MAVYSNIKLAGRLLGLGLLLHLSPNMIMPRGALSRRAQVIESLKAFDRQQKELDARPLETSKLATLT